MCCLIMSCRKIMLIIDIDIYSICTLTILQICRLEVGQDGVRQGRNLDIFIKKRSF